MWVLGSGALGPCGLLGFIFVGWFGCSYVLRSAYAFFNKSFITYYKNKNRNTAELKWRLS
jgi:hypothetical protein